MSRLYDVPLFGDNPVTKRSGSAKKNSKGTKRPATKRGKRTTMAKKGKKGRKGNPLGLSMKGVQGKLMHGLSLGLGAIVARAAVNNLPLPESMQTGLGEAAAAAGIAIGAGMLAKKVKFLAPYADSIQNGGLALAIYKAAAPKLLPSLAFTQVAKNKAQLDANAYALLSAAKAQQAAAATKNPNQDPAPVQGVGDAFVISKQGLTTADRAPRDTAALAGVGDSYAAERPGFSGGAPNRIKAPWSRSIYQSRN